MIHRKIVEKKSALADSYGAQADAVMGKLDTEILDADLTKFELYKNLLADVRAIPNWPVSLDVGVKILISTILIPALTAVVSAALKGGKFGT